MLLLPLRWSAFKGGLLFHHCLTKPCTLRCSAITLLLLQGINRATNAFLKWSLKGEEYQTWLLGLMEMPKARMHNATQRNTTQLTALFWLPALWCG